MSSLSSLNRNVLRISGLNSGMDTESIIQNMMLAEQTKLDRQYRAQAKLEWKVTAHQDVNNELRKLKEEYNTVLKQEQNMLSAYNYRAYTMTYQNTSDSAYVSMTTEPYADAGSISIKVKQLAEAASMTSSYKLTDGNGGLELTMTLGEVSQALTDGNGFSFSFDADDMVRFSFDGNQYEFSRYTTLDTALNAINANSKNLKIGYSQLTDKVTVSNKTMGASSPAPYVESSSFMFALLGIDGTNQVVQNAGKDAIFEINGHEETRSSNEFRIDGINYTLKQTTTVYESDGVTVKDDSKIVNVDISRDLDHTVEMVKKYVDSYNTLLEKLQGLLSEKVDRDYYPLTDEEKSGLTEKEVERWETEAKKGLLRNDSQLSGLIMQMRQSFYMKVPGSTLMMADIGLGGVSSSVAAYEKASKGYIELDETKLRDALRTNPDMVYQMFTYKDPSSTVSNPGDVDQMGLVTRLNTLIDNYIKYNENQTQYSTNVDITRAKERYIDMVEAMYKKEEQLWSRFTALETAMAKLNSQNAWLQQQLGLSTAS